MQDNTEITLDNVINTGENENRIPIPPNDSAPTPEEVEAKRIADEAALKAKGADEGSEGDLTPEQIAAAQEENSNSLKTLLSSFKDETTLSDDDKGIRTDLLTKHKGSSFDAEGNILDANGNTLVSFEKLLEYSTEEETLTLDDKGNQIDTEGNIVKTNVELAVENTVVNKLHSESEYEFLNDDGTTKIYSDDDAGIKDFTNDVSAQRFEEWKGEFFSQTPELAEITKHLLSGGTVDTYKSSIDYSKLDITTMSKDDKLKYIRRSYEVTGLAEERINDLLQLFVDSNTVDKEIGKALPALQTYEEKQTTDRDNAYEQSVKERNKANEEYWGNVEVTVNKGTLSDITIPDTDKPAFFDYLSTAVDDKGNSKEMLDSKKETLEQQLQVKYLRFKGYDLSKLVDSKVGTQKIVSLRDRIKKSAKLSAVSTSSSANTSTKAPADITIDSLLP